MIAFLKGSVEEINEKSIVLDVNGVGYEVYVPSGNDFNRLNVGEMMKVYTYLQISENAVGLYGFFSKDELEMFKMLITVNGIGPKAAIAMLSSMTVNELRLAVLSEDDKTIAKTPGVGAKTAKKLILELKDKIHIEDALEEFAEPSSRSENITNDAVNEAVQALTALGYSGSDALKAVKLAKISAGASTEEILKAALKQLAFL